MQLSDFILILTARLLVHSQTSKELFVWDSRRAAYQVWWWEGFTPFKNQKQFLCYWYGLITGTVFEDSCRKLITSSELCLSESWDYMPWHHIHWKEYLPILINRTKKNIKAICNFLCIGILLVYWTYILLSIEALIAINNIACTCLEAIYIISSSLF